MTAPPGAGAAGPAFFVGADGRARWFWRLLAFAALAFAAALVLTGVAYPLASAAMSAAGVRLIAFSWINVGALLLAHAASLAWVDGRRPWSFVRLGRASLEPRRLAIGAAVGALGIGVPVAALIGAGWMREEPAPAGSWWGTALRFAVILLPFALGEELTFRGYPFAVLRERFGPRVAVVATSVPFGLLHIQNPGSNVQAIAVVMVAGVLLAAVLLVTESLYAAWAAHFAWNWTMAALMHAPVSGLSVTTPGYQLVDAGPDWATGGAWGPEGGLAALIGMSAGLWFLWRRPRTTDTDARPAGRGER